jgi:hypothetical protein
MWEMEWQKDEFYKSFFFSPASCTHSEFNVCNYDAYLEQHRSATVAVAVTSNIT